MNILKILSFLFLVGFIFTVTPFSTGVAQENLPIANIYVDFDNPLHTEDGTISRTGRIYSKVEKIFQNGNVKYQVKLVPWARIMIEAPKVNNALIFQMIRTAQREDNFHWLLPLNSSGPDLYLYTRNDPKFIHLTKTQIVQGKYTAICQSNSAQCELLSEFGFPDDRIFSIPGVKSGMLETFITRNRADFFIGFKNLITRDDIIRLIKVASVTDYLAAPKNIHPGLLAKIKKTIANHKPVI